MFRTDIFPIKANPGKAEKLDALLAVWRKEALFQGKLYWARLFKTGKCGKFDKTKNSTGINAAGLQMVVAQTTGIMDSFLGNLQNEISSIVERSSLPKGTKHALHVVNRSKAWFRKDFAVKGAGIPDSPEIRRLAKIVFKRALARNAKPDLSRIHMAMDHRMATLSRSKKHPAEGGLQKGKFNYWIRCSTLEKGKRVDLPLLGNACFEKREGRVAGMVQLIRRPEGWDAALAKDVSEPYAKSRAAYVPKVDEIALDLGLSVFLATDQGGLLGRGWLEALSEYDRAISKLAAERQRRGLKVRSPRYDRLVAKLRGFIKTQVGRILNRLVETKAPGKLILERLDFRNQALSRRMNRLIGNFGKGVLAAKLADLSSKFGIEVEHRNPAYTSQECPSCHFISKANRKARDSFLCLWCGKKLHADVAGARNLKDGRSALASVSGGISRRVLQETLESQATVFRPWALSGDSRRGRASPGTLWEGSAFHKAGGLPLPETIKLHAALQDGIPFPTSECK